MKKHKKKLIWSVVVLMIVLFIWNQTLYIKKPSFPIDEKNVVAIYICPDLITRDYALELSQEDAQKLIALTNSLELQRDDSWKKTRDDTKTIPWAQSFDERRYHIYIWLDKTWTSKTTVFDLCYHDSPALYMHVRAPSRSNMRNWIWNYDAKDSMEWYDVTDGNYNEVLTLLEELSNKYFVDEQQ